MDRFKELLLVLWGLFFVFLLYQTAAFVKYKRFLQKLKSTPLPPHLKKYICNLPEYKKLSFKEKRVLEYKIQRFMSEKEFIGVYLKITDEIKTLISFYACLITVAYEDFCYPSLKYVYVYPNTIRLKKLKRGYVVNEDVLISGEAVGESVVIAWEEAKKEIKHSKRNVIIHEFAHELDYEEGELNGIPPLEEGKYYEFAKIMHSEYKKFREKVLKNRNLGKYRLIDRYAATNEEEFFAVLSEYYFEKSDILRKHFPALYKELKAFYKIEM